jgi:hypothetical protein
VGQSILESLAALPETEAAPKLQLLESIELELAKTATASDGAHQLLSLLSQRGQRIRHVAAKGTANSHICSFRKPFSLHWTTTSGQHFWTS